MRSSCARATSASTRGPAPRSWISRDTRRAFSASRHGIDAVDQWHRPPALRRAVRLTRADEPIRRRPRARSAHDEHGRHAAPGSDAPRRDRWPGTARSSSGPESAAGQRDANRMKQRASLRPVCLARARGRRAERRRDPAARPRNLVGKRRDGARAVRLRPGPAPRRVGVPVEDERDALGNLLDAIDRPDAPSAAATRRSATRRPASTA